MKENPPTPTKAVEKGPTKRLFELGGPQALAMCPCMRYYRYHSKHSVVVYGLHKEPCNRNHWKIYLFFEIRNFPKHPRPMRHAPAWAFLDATRARSLLQLRL